MAKSEEVKDPASKGKLKLIIVAVVALLLAVGLSAGATWFIMHKSESAPDPAVAAAAANAKPVAVLNR